jgi:ParB family chromosome partitioning protein
MDIEKDVQLIPVDKIHILNPRNRDSKKFAQIVASIAHLGLKRPIVVSRRSESAGDECYDLVCGQGRLEAFIALKQESIYAIIVDISREERLLGSLVENCARRTPRAFEMVKQVGMLRDRGYKNADIARKIDMDETTVGAVLRLLDQGEERLLQAVEAGRIPVSVATIIASSSDKEVQKALTQAYDSKSLRGKPLLRATRLVEQRRMYGKNGSRGAQRTSKPVTSDAIVRVFEQESKRQRLAIKKAELCDTRLLFIVNALKSILADENFRNLLRAEKLETLPTYLAEQLGRS